MSNSSPIAITSPYYPADQSLLQRLKEQDPEALELLYDRTHRLLFALALRITNNPKTAEIILTNVFAQIWRDAPLLVVASDTSLLSHLIVLTRTHAQQGIPTNLPMNKSLHSALGKLYKLLADHP